ncbi:MAG: FemAB family PEP-CTERM system-associated protein [candidate division KSB1 bacterium]|nr:FemAB family PEP-CTERM system-associated protein [candidate division KSB1 bacterium]
MAQFDLSMKREWDQFVDAHEKGTFFHKIVWKNIIEKTFSYQSLYLACYKGLRLTGVLPLFYLKSIFGGKALISTPFGVYGGVLANDAESEKKLIHAAKDCAEELGASYIELRQQFAIQYPDLQIKDKLYCTFIQKISDSPEGNLALLPREARRLVRRAIANGLEVHFTREIKEFYHIYAASVRNLGTPVFPVSLFENIFSEAGAQADILLVTHKGKGVAGVMSFYYKQTVLPYYGGSLPSKRYLAPNNYMYYSLINHASEKGISYFDFGRSKVNTGAYHFKRHMGFSPTPLPYQYYLMNGARIPNNNPLNPKFRLAIGIWRRLPLAMTKVIGPKIVKQFP